MWRLMGGGGEKWPEKPVNKREDSLATPRTIQLSFFFVFTWQIGLAVQRHVHKLSGFKHPATEISSHESAFIFSSLSSARRSSLHRRRHNKHLRRSSAARSPSIPSPNELQIGRSTPPVPQRRGNGGVGGRA